MGTQAVLTGLFTKALLKRPVKDLPLSTAGDAMKRYQAGSFSKHSIQPQLLLNIHLDLSLGKSFFKSGSIMFRYRLFSPAKFMSQYT